MMRVTGMVWATIRTDGEHEWIDLNGVSGCMEIPGDAAKLLDEKIPAWAKANPVVRTARIRLTEEAPAE